MRVPFIQPPRIKKGDTIGIIAPAGPIQDRRAFEQGVSRLESMGFRVKFDDRIFQSFRYLAGEDEARAEALMESFEDPSIHAIIALRGGYGCSRIIPLLDKERLRTHAKIFMGFSDLTTLHLYFQNHLGWVTFHGPMILSQALAEITREEEEHLQACWTVPNYKSLLMFPQMSVLKPGVAEGILTGGCLSTIVSSIGTPYEIQTEGRILFLEDQGEAPYRLDRMITQLRHSGKLDSIAGILLGEFVDCETSQGDYTALEAIADALSPLDVPILANFPAGHGRSNWVLPLGTRVRMSSEPKTIEFLEPCTQ